MVWRVRWVDYDLEEFVEYFDTKEEAWEFVHESIDHDFYEVDEVWE